MVGRVAALVNGRPRHGRARGVVLRHIRHDTSTLHPRIMPAFSRNATQPRRRWTAHNRTCVETCGLWRSGNRTLCACAHQSDHRDHARPLEELMLEFSFILFLFFITKFSIRLALRVRVSTSRFFG